MKKLISIIIAICLISCNSDDEPTITESGFNADITKVLDVIDDHT